MTVPEGRNSNEKENFSKTAMKRPPTDPRRKQPAFNLPSQSAPSSSNPDPQQSVNPTSPNVRSSKHPQPVTASSSSSQSQKLKMGPFNSFSLGKNSNKSSNSTEPTKSKDSFNVRQNSPPTFTRSNENSKMPLGHASDSSKMGSFSSYRLDRKNKKPLDSEDSEGPSSKIPKVSQKVSSGVNSKDPKESGSQRTRTQVALPEISKDPGKQSSPMRKSFDHSSSPGSLGNSRISESPKGVFQSSTNFPLLRSPPRFWNLEEAEKRLEESRSYFKKLNPDDFYTSDERKEIKNKALFQADIAMDVFKQYYSLKDNFKKASIELNKFQEETKKQEEETKTVDKDSKHEKEVQSLFSKLKTAEEKNKKLTTELENLQNSLKKKDSEIVNLKKSEAVKAEFENYKKVTKQEIDRLKEEGKKNLEDMTQIIKEKDFEISKLNKSKEAMDKEIQLIKDTWNRREAEKTKNKSDSKEKNNLQNNITDLKFTIEQLNQNLQEKSIMEKYYKNEINDLKVKLNAEKDLRMSVEKELKTTKTTLKDVEAQLIAKNKELLKRSSKVSIQSDELPVVEEIVKVKEEEITQKNTEVSKLPTKINDFEKQTKTKSQMSFDISKIEYEILLEDFKKARNYMKNAMEENKNLIQKTMKFQKMLEKRKSKIGELKKILKKNKNIQNQSVEQNQPAPSRVEERRPAVPNNPQIRQNKTSTISERRNSNSLISQILLNSGNITPSSSNAPQRPPVPLSADNTVLLPSSSGNNQRRQILKKSSSEITAETSGRRNAVNIESNFNNNPMTTVQCPIPQLDQNPSGISIPSFEQQEVQMAVENYVVTNGGTLTGNQMELLMQWKNKEQNGTLMTPNEIISSLVQLTEINQPANRPQQRTPGQGIQNQSRQPVLIPFVQQGIPSMFQQAMIPNLGIQMMNNPGSMFQPGVRHSMQQQPPQNPAYSHQQQPQNPAYPQQQQPQNPAYSHQQPPQNPAYPHQQQPQNSAYPHQQPPITMRQIQQNFMNPPQFHQNIMPTTRHNLISNHQIPPVQQRNAESRMTMNQSRNFSMMNSQYYCNQQLQGPPSGQASRSLPDPRSLNFGTSQSSLRSQGIPQQPVMNLPQFQGFRPPQNSGIGIQYPQQSEVSNQPTVNSCANSLPAPDTVSSNNANDQTVSSKAEAIAELVKILEEDLPSDDKIRMAFKKIMEEQNKTRRRNTKEAILKKINRYFL